MPEHAGASAAGPDFGQQGVEWIGSHTSGDVAGSTILQVWRATVAVTCALG